MKPAPVRTQALRELLESCARQEGFCRIGVARAQRPPRFDLFDRWIDEERHGAMEYLSSSRRMREDPSTLLPGACSVIVLAFPHSAADPSAPDGARTARYALSEDYHRTLRQRCQRLVDALAREAPSLQFRTRICVDSAPLNERAFAAAAGIGWIGKNGMILNEDQGSYFLLCEIITDLELPVDAPVTERCGACVRCLTACPTEAFLLPGLLDARRCLSYWTIEQRGTIPQEIARNLSGRVFGCDICQEVCPYNSTLPVLPFETAPPSLAELLGMTSGKWKRDYRRTPLARAGAAGLKRNAAAAAESSRRVDLLPALERLAHASHPVVAEQAVRAAKTLQANEAP